MLAFRCCPLLAVIGWVACGVPHTEPSACDHVQCGERNLPDERRLG